ncbi:MAG: hypothetical protein LBV16_00675, partial [Elusimicrobiota bacterium]|nr:hypothetical protein [Elusimicrobiota bacterium]
GGGGPPSLKLVNDTLRYIDWKTGPEGPRVMRKEDFKKLKKAAQETDALFARRFDKAIDADIIEMVYKDILYT